MNHTLSETYGIDTHIQEIQTVLYDKLVIAWGTSNVDAYGRVYRNHRDGKHIPEVYDSTSGNYKETLYNNQSCFFFVDAPDHSTEDEELYKADVKIVFMLNLKDIKASSERVDADVRRDVISILRNDQYKFDISGFEQTLDVALKGFDTSKVMTNDMQPLHVFAVNGTIEYFITDKCS